MTHTHSDAAGGGTEPGLGAWPGEADAEAGGGAAAAAVVLAEQVTLGMQRRDSCRLRWHGVGVRHDAEKQEPPPPEPRAAPHPPPPPRLPNPLANQARRVPGFVTPAIPPASSPPLPLHPRNCLPGHGTRHLRRAEGLIFDDVFEPAAALHVAVRGTDRSTRALIERDVTESRAALTRAPPPLSRLPRAPPATTEAPKAAGSAPLHDVDPSGQREPVGGGSAARHASAKSRSASSVAPYPPPRGSLGLSQQLVPARPRRALPRLPTGSILHEQSYKQCPTPSGDPQKGFLREETQDRRSYLLPVRFFQPSQRSLIKRRSV